MRVYYMIKNAKGRYLRNTFLFDASRIEAHRWSGCPGPDLKYARTQDPTARIVRVTVTRKRVAS